MTIASELQRIENNIINSYTAAENKGATLPEVQNSDNLATCINSISTSSGDRLNSAIPYKVSTNGNNPAIDQYGIARYIGPQAFFEYPFLVKNSNWELIINAIAYYQGSYDFGPWYLCSITNKFNIFLTKQSGSGNLKIALDNYISNTWDQSYIGITTLPYDNYLYFKLSYNKDTTDLTLYTSTDGINYTQEVQIQKNEDMSGILYIGAIPFLAVDSKNAWCGIMDLSKSSLKIDNKVYPFFTGQ